MLFLLLLIVVFVIFFLELMLMFFLYRLNKRINKNEDETKQLKIMLHDYQVDDEENFVKLAYGAHYNDRVLRSRQMVLEKKVKDMSS